MSETIQAIKRVVVSRIEKGATKLDIDRYLTHLLIDVWKDNAYIRKEILQFRHSFLAYH